MHHSDNRQGPHGFVRRYDRSPGPGRPRRRGPQGMRWPHKILRLAPVAAVAALWAWPPAAGAAGLLPERASLRTAAVDGLLPWPYPTPSATPAPAPPPPPPSPSGTADEQRPRKHHARNIILSNERTLSRWAFVTRPVTARRKPSGHAGQIKRLRTYTSDATPELALVLRKLIKPNGAVWLKIRLPMRPNNR